MILTRRQFGLSLAASTLATPSLVRAATPAAIRIGSTAPGHLKFILFRHYDLLGKEFKAEGIPVELVTFDGGSAASVALGSGQLELMYTGNNPALRLAASGADVKAVGLSSWNPQNETVIVVKADSALQKVADLKGKNVAYLPGTVRHSTFSKALALDGLTTNDLASFNFDVDTAGPALSRGDVDAIVDSLSTVQPLIDQGLARLIFDASAYPQWVTPFPISVYAPFARNYPEILARILAVDIETAAWADKNPDETIATFAAEIGRKESSVRKTYPKNVFYQDPNLTDAAVASLKEEEAFMAANALLEGKVDYDKWVDRSYYQAAVALLPSRTN